jgi:hypothetical protein
MMPHQPTITQPNHATYLQRVSRLRRTQLRRILQQSLKTCTHVHNFTPLDHTPIAALLRRTHFLNRSKAIAKGGLKQTDEKQKERHNHLLHPASPPPSTTPTTPLTRKPKTSPTQPPPSSTYPSLTNLRNRSTHRAIYIVTCIPRQSGYAPTGRCALNISSMYSYIPLHATAFTPQRARSKKEGEDRRKTREKAQRRIIEKTEEKLTS